MKALSIRKMSLEALVSVEDVEGEIESGTEEEEWSCCCCCCWFGMPFGKAAARRAVRARAASTGVGRD